MNEWGLVAELLGVGSIREVARRHGTEPGNLSKLLARIEKAAGVTLATRTSAGLTPTEAGNQLLEKVAQLLNHAASLNSEPRDAGALVGIGAVPFINTHLLAHAVAGLPPDWAGSGARVRLLDLSADDLLGAAIKGACAICLHDTPFDWPRSWHTEAVGTVTWRRYIGRQGKQAKAAKTGHSVDAVRYVFPVYWSRDGVVYGDDRHPLPLDKRTLGIGVSSADAAVRLIQNGNLVGSLPDLVALEHLRQRLIEPFTANANEITQRTLLVSVKSGAVAAKALKTLVAAVKGRLAQVDKDLSDLWGRGSD